MNELEYLRSWIVTGLTMFKITPKFAIFGDIDCMY